MRHEIKTIEDLHGCCVINAPKVIHALEKLGFKNQDVDEYCKAIYIAIAKLTKAKCFFKLEIAHNKDDTKFIVPQDIFDLLPKTKQMTLELTEEQIESLKQQRIL